MITRIEIDGFKTFQDFAVDLAPFQVIIGPNGSGKSNFFDAIHLLSRTADQSLLGSFFSLRGKQREQFTVQPNGHPVDKMRFKIEMLVPAVVADKWGQEVRLANTRLCYELEVGRHLGEYGTEWLSVNYETLKSIPFNEDAWLTRHSALVGSAAFVKSGQADYIYTPHPGNENAEVQVLEDTVGTFTGIPRFSGQLLSTTLSAMDKCTTPHALAARQELQRWQFENVSAEVMRLSPDLGFPNTPGEYITGNSIPQVLARLKVENPREFASVSHDMANLVPNLKTIEVDVEPEGRTVVYARMQDERRFSIRLLSDGTLRFLALATLRNDPKRRGVSGGLCFEDPEMGVHPGALERIVRLLRGMATDLNDPEDMKLPLRQVLVTTHSPELVSHLNVEQEELLFAVTPNRVVSGKGAWQVTRMYPVRIEGDKKTPEGAYALTGVLAYLSGSSVQAAQKKLREAYLR